MIKSMRMRWAGYVAHMGRRGMLIGFWWESQKKRLRRRWEDNIRIDRGKIGWVGMDWIHPTQDRALVSTVMNLHVP
jgi:hypothetical protein